MTKGGVYLDRGFERKTTITADTVLADSTEILFEAFAGGVLYVPSGATSQTLEVHTSDVIGGTYLPLYDADGVQVTIAIVASRAYELPAACYGCCVIKLVALTSDESGLALHLKG